MKRKSFLLIMLMLFFGSAIFAQTNKVLSELELGSYSHEWQMYESLEMVDIYYKYSDCSDAANDFYPEFILFRVVNKTKNEVYVYWNYTVSQNDQLVLSSPNENLVQVFLNPNQTVEGTCGEVWKTKLGILVREKKLNSKLTDFNLNKINEFKL